MKVRKIAYWRNNQRKTYVPRSKSWAQYIRHRARHLKVGTIIETCGCDVARIIMVDAASDSIDYESLTTGLEGSCSIYNCAPCPLRPVAVERRLALFKEGGKKALVRRYYIEDCNDSPEVVERFMKDWR